MMDESFEAAAKEFQGLADKFRRIDADDVETAKWLVKRTAVRAAMAFRRFRIDALLHIKVEWPTLSFDRKQFELWDSTWSGLVLGMSQIFPDRVPPDVGAMHITGKGEGYSKGKDWRPRADDYAMICDLIAEIASAGGTTGTAGLAKDPGKAKRLSDQPVAQSGRVTLFGPKDRPLIDGKEMPKLTPAEYDGVLLLIEGMPHGLTKDELYVERGGTLTTLKTLAKKYSEWDSVLKFPGKTGQRRYRIE